MGITLLGCIADETSPKAMAAYHSLSQKYDFVDITKKRSRPEALVVLGGDGFMLQVLHKHMHKNIPIYGMNCGSVGFLMNSYHEEDLLERIDAAREATLRPLSMYARTMSGHERHELAINEVSLFRESRQAAKVAISVDHVVRIRELICDGVMVSTPAGSTAYNFSAGGPIIPLSANVLALTSMGAFRPRHWRGALLPHKSSIALEILEPEKRPVSAVADFTEIRDVVSVTISEEQSISLKLLFDPEHNLEERIIKEQFIYQ